MFKTAEGVHPEYLKGLTDKKAIESLPLPKRVILPLIQHVGAPCQPVVSVGDKVKVGTLLATSDKYIAVPVHSSISGTVVAIERRVHPAFGFAQAVEIESDGLDERAPLQNFANFVTGRDLSLKERQNFDSLGADDLRKIIKEAGIVGLGGAAFPTHVKLSPPPDKKVDTFILNGVECEPYLTCDHRVMIERTLDVIAGLKLILKILGVRKAFIAIEKNKPDAIKAMKEAVQRTMDEGRWMRDELPTVVALKVKYPQGAEKQLIKTILKREVPSGGLPMDIGVVVSNVATSAAIYEAVRFGKPLYERVVTVTGAVREPKNLLVRIGTPIKELIEFCGGYSQEPGKVVMGGPMMGIAQKGDEAPVIKGTSGILVLSREESRPKKVLPCIRCGRCVEACPVDLSPCGITVAAEFEKYEIAREYDLFDCIECGACAWVCPSKRPMVHLVKHAKAMSRK